MSSAGNSSSTSTTTGGWRTADSAGSSSPSPAQPDRRTTAASSAASQQDHRAAIGYLEHLHLVASLTQRVLGNHDGVALGTFPTEVKASPNCGDSAIHRNGYVALAAGGRAA